MYYTPSKINHHRPMHVHYKGLPYHPTHIITTSTNEKRNSRNIQVAVVTIEASVETRKRAVETKIALQW